MSGSIAELDVHGPNVDDALRYRIPEGRVFRLGRSPENGIKVPWDKGIDGEYADVWFQDGRLFVRCLRNVKTSIQLGQKRMREVAVTAGERFMIGDSSFQVVKADPVLVAAGPLSEGITTVAAESSSSPDAQSMADRCRAPRVFDRDHFETSDDSDAEITSSRSFSADDLRQAGFGNAENQMEILSQLPELISSCPSDEELGKRLVRLLLDAIPQAEAIAVACFDVSQLPPSGETSSSFPKPHMMHVHARDDFDGRFNPSRRMISACLTQQQSVMQIWSDKESSSGKFTISEGLGWAFVTPIRDESCRGWCLYVAGKGSRSRAMITTEDDLKGDLRFTELVAQFIGSVRQVRLLQEQKTQMSAFFSPTVIESVTGGDTSALDPAECEITVMFCDVRGFSRRSEQQRDDLLMLLRNTSSALGVMANGILERNGVIADFQGDAALGFWGWPVRTEAGPIPACLAALDIHRQFRKANEERQEHLRGFSVGLGVAHGQALAGQIGTSKQAKVGVFGPVVNQGSRLEGMTRQFGVPICVDEATGAYARRYLPQSEGRLRTLAKVRPKGMDSPVTVSALLPPLVEFPEVTDEMIAAHEQAVMALVEGEWADAEKILSNFPPTDGPAEFLKSFLLEAGKTPPADWDGAITLFRK